MPPIRARRPEPRDAERASMRRFFMRRSWTILRIAVLLTACFMARPSPAADEGYISGPFVHENLAIYLVHGNSSGGPVPLTLDEALTKKAAKVHETGDVNSLEIENVGDEPIFVQSGDIVKGGQQDRALTASLLLPPRSGRTRVAVFCVEHGRWWPRRGRKQACSSRWKTTPWRGPRPTTSRHCKARARRTPMSSATPSR